MNHSLPHANRPTLPSRHRVSRVFAPLLAAVVAMAGCAMPQAPLLLGPSGSSASASVTADRLTVVLKPEPSSPDVNVLLLGEQHDAPDHHQIEQQVIATLAARQLLAALALEMADAGATTAALKPRASEAQVQLALNWSESSWPWADYGPSVMTAVRAGVPVIGANLPKGQMQTSMANAKFDGQLPGAALKAQQQLIRSGHCNLLPENQVTPMTRIQIAKDISMAAAVSDAAVPGKVVVLITGSVHANRQIGVPQHLPKKLHVKTVLLQAGEGPDQDKAFDATWGTPALPATDYCASLRTQFKAK